MTTQSTQLNPYQTSLLITRMNYIIEDPERLTALYLLLNYLQASYFRQKVLQNEDSFHHHYAEAIENLLMLVAVPLEQNNA